MGNCCGSQSQEVEGHHLQTTNKSCKKTGGQTLGGGTSAQVGKEGNEGSREAMLSAAEQRRIQAENRGVAKEGGGKLSKQLAEERKQNVHQVNPVKNEPDLVVNGIN